MARRRRAPISAEQGGLVVENLNGLMTAFSLAGKEAKTELRVAQREVAEPVASIAQTKALSSIRNMPQMKTTDWSAMRIGVTKNLVYVVPKEKGRRGRGDPRYRRKNLKDLLLDRSMIPALSSQMGAITRRFEHVLRTVGKTWERSG